MNNRNNTFTFIAFCKYLFLFLLRNDNYYIQLQLIYNNREKTLKHVEITR